MCAFHCADMIYEETQKRLHVSSLSVQTTSVGLFTGNSIIYRKDRSHMPELPHNLQLP